MRKKYLVGILLCGLMMLASCRLTKNVPDGSYLLNRVSVKVNGEGVDKETLNTYVRPRPNFKVFGIWRLQLHLYNMAGKDTTKWINRQLRNVGDAPVIFKESDAITVAHKMEKALSNKGYIHASVDVKPTFKKKKANVTYQVNLNNPYRVRNFSLVCLDDSIQKEIGKDTAVLKINKGMLFDSEAIDLYREDVASYLRQKGYYRLTKESLYFIADSTYKTHEVDLKAYIRLPGMTSTRPDTIPKNGGALHPRYTVGRVYIVTNFDPLRDDGSEYLTQDGLALLQKKSVPYKEVNIYDIGEKYLRPDLLRDNCYIVPGKIYNERLVTQTYTSLTGLSAMKSANIRFVEREGNTLDCVIFLALSPSQSFTTNLEGTNTSGDLGFAGSLNYQHRNIFSGSETFNFKVRGAFESVGGNVSALLDKYYYELGAESSVSFPKFMFPFLDRDFKRNLKASTEVSLAYGVQSRPEFERTVASSAFSYRWNRKQKSRYVFDLIDLSYVYLPWVSDAFEKEFLSNNSYLKYSYQSHMIMKSGLSFSYSSLLPGVKNRDVHTIRASVETAGNFLWVASKAFHFDQKEDYYTLFNIRYEQYLKGYFDFSKQYYIDDKNSLALHVGGGVAMPYGNSEIVPFEKRFFSGGANSVRGWSVRSLGPGTYSGVSRRIDYVNQSGDVKLDANIEYRSKLFWKLQMAAFIDMGNIWTIREYEEQPGGVFDVKTFYKQIAGAYGFGMRLDFNYFLLRLDFGMKAYNPSAGATKWPLFSPEINRDMAIHFAIGYPF
ncbi:MAG: BamA/TamA family outer membrane protein [Bacteroidales bacterium]|nr:BamA/TamA family outer membrane protein [Bacteroidales bacterium]